MTYTARLCLHFYVCAGDAASHRDHADAGCVIWEVITEEKRKIIICILFCPFLVQWCHVVWKVAKTACKHTGCNINYVWKCNQREQLRLIERTASHMAQQYGVTLVHVSTAELQKSNSIFCCMVRVPFYRSCPYIFQCLSWYRPVSQKKITDICFGEH